MSISTVCLNPQKSPLKASTKNTSDDGYAASKLQQIKNKILSSFRNDPQGTLSHSHQLMYKQDVVQLVQHLIKRYKMIEQIMSNSRTRPRIIQECRFLNINEKDALKKYSQKILDNQRVLSQLKSKLKDAQQKIQNQKQKRQKLEKENSQLLKALESMRNISNKMVSSYSQERNIFLGQILIDEPDYKQFLADVIQGFMGKKIKYCKHLYSMDLLNKTNFHKYIDNKPNLLLVTLLKNGYTVAAFTEQAISERMSLQKKGLIISLTNRKCFHSYKKAASYDSFYLIFGNNQLRILSGKDTIYSNLGASNGYYENKDHQRVNILLGEGSNRETTMQSYDLLEIQFK